MSKPKDHDRLSFSDIRRLLSGVLSFIILTLFRIPITNWGTEKYQTLIQSSLSVPNLLRDITTAFWGIASSTSYWLMFTILFGVPFGLSLRARTYTAGGLKNGVYKDRVSLATIFARVNPWRWIAVVQKIHMFQHEFEKSLTLVTKNPEKEISIDLKDFRKGIGALLYKSKDILDVLLRDDVHVHIKLFQNENIPTREAQEAHIENSELRTYARCVSTKEFDETQTRNSKEIFLAIPEHHDDYKNYIEYLRKENPPLDSKTISDYGVRRVNSAYNYVLHEQAHFFVCNNLKAAQEKHVFYSTSHQWENYYNSLAVFVIYPHVAHGMPVGNPKGLLVIDSLSTGKFDKNALRDVGGYLAHRFFDFFEIIKEHPAATKSRKKGGIKQLVAPKLAIDAG